MIKKSIATVLDGDLHIGCTPTQADVNALSLSGCKSMLSLNHGDETGLPSTTASEARWARSLGMEHAEVPLDRAQLRPADVDAVVAALARLPRPVFVHSAQGSRAAAVAIIHRALTTGTTAQQAHRWAEDYDLRLESSDLYRFVVREVMRRQPRDAAPLLGDGYQAGQAVARRDKPVRGPVSAPR